MSSTVREPFPYPGMSKREPAMSNRSGCNAVLICCRLWGSPESECCLAMFSFLRQLVEAFAYGICTLRKSDRYYCWRWVMCLGLTMSTLHLYMAQLLSCCSRIFCSQDTKEKKKTSSLCSSTISMSHFCVQQSSDCPS